jgi:hypothetical protein
VAYSLVRTTLYEQAWGRLNPNARALLNYAVLPGIADDPHHRVGRHDYPGGVVVDNSAERLYVAYAVNEATRTVVLLEVEDGQQPSIWFTKG